MAFLPLGGAGDLGSGRFFPFNGGTGTGGFLPLSGGTGVGGGTGRFLPYQGAGAAGGGGGAPGLGDLSGAFGGGGGGESGGGVSFSPAPGEVSGLSGGRAISSLGGRALGMIAGATQSAPLGFLAGIVGMPAMPLGLASLAQSFAGLNPTSFVSLGRALNNPEAAITSAQAQALANLTAAQNASTQAFNNAIAQGLTPGQAAALAALAQGAVQGTTAAPNMENLGSVFGSGPQAGRGATSAPGGVFGGPRGSDIADPTGLPGAQVGGSPTGPTAGPPGPDTSPNAGVAPDTGQTAPSSGDGGGGGAGCHLATWTMGGMASKDAKKYRAAFSRFRTAFLHANPQHGPAALAQYQTVARQIIARAEADGPEMVKAVQAYLRDALMERTHAHMTKTDVNSAVQNLTTVVSKLARMFGVAGGQQHRFVPLGEGAGHAV